jgi:hypothetical protein
MRAPALLLLVLFGCTARERVEPVHRLSCAWRKVKEPVRALSARLPSTGGPTRACAGPGRPSPHGSVMAGSRLAPCSPRVYPKAGGRA